MYNIIVTLEALFVQMNYTARSKRSNNEHLFNFNHFKWSLLYEDNMWNNACHVLPAFAENIYTETCDLFYFIWGGGVSKIKVRREM